MATMRTTLGELVETLVRAAEEDGDNATEIYAAASVAVARALLRADRTDLLQELETLALEFEPAEERRHDSKGVEAVAS